MMSRWLSLFAALVIVTFVSWFLFYRVWTPPIPQPCDPQRIIADQQAQIADLGSWIGQTQLLVGMLFATFAFWFLYVQVTHSWPRWLAGAGVVSVVAVPAIVAGLAYHSRVSAWLRLNNLSCIAEAARTGQASGLSFVGRYLNPDSFLIGVAAEAALVVGMATFMGGVIYLLARRAVRL